MRKFIFTLVAVFAFASCELETSDNGHLDGFWQMRAVDTLSTGGSADTRESGIFWSVQMRLLEVVDTKGRSDKVFFRFEHTGDSLFLSQPYIDNRDSGDIKVTDAELLRPYGIFSLEPHFCVRELNGGRMVLESDSLRMYFRKY